MPDDLSNDPEPVEPQRRDALRASDHDRNRVVTLLSDALGQGQITFGEYEERSHQAVAATTFTDLDRLVADLPAARPRTDPAVREGHAAIADPEGLPRLGDTKYAVMSETKVHGPIAVGAEHSAVAFWGGVTLDLREATFLAREVTINAYAVMGGITIIVPPGATVHEDGLAIMGGFEHTNPSAGTGAGPHITVRGVAFWGGVEIKQK